MTTVELTAASPETLRDRFAMAALTGLLAAYADPTQRLPKARGAALDAYDYADAMLRVRTERPDTEPPDEE